jgi:hypothetical protein
MWSMRHLEHLKRCAKVSFVGSVKLDSPPTSAKVENTWIYTGIATYVFRA